MFKSKQNKNVIGYSHVQTSREILNEKLVSVEAPRVQRPVLKYHLGLKTARVQGTLKTRMEDGYQHILNGVIVIRGRKMAANGEVCISQPG